MLGLEARARHAYMKEYYKGSEDGFPIDFEIMMVDLDTGKDIHTKHGDELIELAWGIIANAGHGNWENESVEWQEAAFRWRDGWHKWLDGEIKHS